MKAGSSPAAPTKKGHRGNGAPSIQSLFFNNYMVEANKQSAVTAEPDVLPAAAPAPIQVEPELPWLVAKYTFASDVQLTAAYGDVAKGLAIFEEVPRGNLAVALRQHLNVIVAEQNRRGEASA